MFSEQRSLYQEKFGDRFHIASLAMVVFCAFSIPLPITFISVGSGLLLLFWILSGNYAEKFSNIKNSGVALSALLLFLLLVVGLTYTSAEQGDALRVLGKYKKLLFFPIIISLALTEKWRKWAIAAFMISITVTLIVSYMRYFNILPQGKIGSEYIAFKSRIAHGIFMACYFYLLIHAAVIYKSYRWIFILLAIIACHNLLFMNTGRSGYVCFAALLFLLCFQFFKWRGFLIASLSLSILLITAYMGSDKFRDRINGSITEYNEHVPGNYEHVSGLRYRLEFYNITGEIMAELPFMGHGTGSLKEEYRKLAEPRGMYVTDNPHNEFMMILVQIGLPGLAVLLTLLYLQWKASLRLSDYDKFIVQGVWITFASGSILNSLLLDGGEGRFYVFLTAIALCALSDKKNEPLKNRF
jgi:O-antigen ligase